MCSIDFKPNAPGSEWKPAWYNFSISRNPSSDPSCEQAIEESGASGPPAMMVWLDARAGGLALQLDLIHAAEACAKPIVVPLSTLSAEGAEPQLLDAVRAAQEQ